MPQPDLPLWARGVAAILLVIAAWWLLHTETLYGVTGDAIAPLSLGVVAGFILRGMHLPLGLWPNGPWRKEFSTVVLVVVAIVFGALVVATRPSRSPELAAILSPGMFLVILGGVLAWGFALAFVQQRGFLEWYGVAAVAGLAPWLVAVLGLAIGGGEGATYCLLSTQGGPEAAGCSTSAVDAMVFLTVIGVPAGLVTSELAFRRLIIGHPDHAGLVLVLASAAVTLLWWLAVAPALTGVSAPWWLVALGAVGAGSVYVLSGTLLVASVYTALVMAGYASLIHATPLSAGSEVLAPGWEFLAVHAVAVGVMGYAVWRRRGLLRGFR
ncbi:MAG: hypothetical protein JSW43_02725 [Gemmatimonadota bacterium]|nr:MAG: hypothetical protein JSW43_02725 [Gemmatimonadota bacterium]